MSMYIYMEIKYIYVDICIYKIGPYICNQENNMLPRLSPLWLCGKSCTWAHKHHVPKCMRCHKALGVITAIVAYVFF